MQGMLLDHAWDADTLVQLRASLHDVTERLVHSHENLREKVTDLRSELELKDRQLEREDRLASLGRMSAAVAHEIRNPLGGIGLYADLLRKELDGDKEKARLVDQILMGVSGLNKLVEDMLEFASPPKVNKRTCDVGQVADRALSLLKHEIDARGTVVENRSLGVVARMDPDIMAGAFGNIALNALQAMGKRGRLVIEAHNRRMDGRRTVAITFTDTGPGVPLEIAEKVFDPFFTSRDGGTGLGLSIVHSAIDSHGGTVGISEAAGGGAVFNVVLPEE